MAILAESHASFHSYPEHGIWMADIFVCGDRTDPWAAVKHLTNALGGHHQAKMITRPLETATIGELAS